LSKTSNQQKHNHLSDLLQSFLWEQEHQRDQLFTTVQCKKNFVKFRSSRPYSTDVHPGTSSIPFLLACKILMPNKIDGNDGKDVKGKGLGAPEVNGFQMPK